MTKKTIKNLAKYLGVTEQGLYYKKKNKPLEFNLLWLGWQEHLRYEEYQNAK